MDEQYAAIMLDVDYFKNLNGIYGHPSSNLCLKRIAGAIVSELCNENDLAVRLGGEESLMLLTNSSLEDAIRLGERIRRKVEGLSIPHSAPGLGNGLVTISVGAMAGQTWSHRISELSPAQTQRSIKPKDVAANAYDLNNRV